jgi:predicted TIM-barrel fold metal-dependent hydrolase
MALPFKIVSADSHVIEPPDLWTKHIDARFRDRAPRIIRAEKSDYFQCEGQLLEDHGIGLVATKRKYEAPDKYNFTFDEGRWEDVPEAGWDPIARVAEMEREGVEAELIYTSFGLVMYAIPDREFRYACFRAFNNWLAEFCAAAPKRLFGIAMIPTDSIEHDVAELERCAKMGLRGAMVSIAQGSGESYNSPKFDPLWTAAQSLGLPISLHVSASETNIPSTGNSFADFSCGFTPTMYTVATMIFAGLLDRFPKLKVLSVENDASWPLAILERMDDRWLHDQSWAGGETVTSGPVTSITSGRLPSQIFRDQVGCTFMRDRTAIVNRDIIGRQNIMFGTDYPHFDGAWPRSGETLERQFEGVSREDQLLIGRKNVIEFYDLPLTV